MEKYVLIQWPQSQEIMEQEWFEDECHLCLNDEKFGPATYFVPEIRYNDFLMTKLPFPPDIPYPKNK